MATYGTAAGVAAYTAHMTNVSGAFDTTTNPTLAQVEEFLVQMSARLTGWLAHASYVVPVNQADAKAILDNYANMGAAGLCELTQRSAGATDDVNQRENKFLREFAKAEAFINGSALGALGVSQVRAQGPLFGLSSGGRTGTGQPLKPIFTRTSFGNNPTAETGSPEPGYTEGG